ncbi:MAG: 2-amino-4-hydroxy-6-hydroxymethyldihydropteridine diphosphokinase [Maritimibacter sp.]
MPQVQNTVNLGSKALIALGSNVSSKHGSPLQTLQKSINLLGSAPLTILAKSSLYFSPCFPAGAGPDYVNALILVQTSLNPTEVLATLHRVEAELDRDRPSRWAPRTLDLDLITMDQKILPDQSTLQKWINLPLEDQKTASPETLILPHPRVQDRAFVLVPMAEIAPEWQHPLTGLTCLQMLDALPKSDRAAVRILTQQELKNAAS